MDPERLRSVARECALLSPLTDAELDTLIASAETATYTDNQCIFREGDEDTDLCIIMAGHVRISQQSASGEVKTLALLSSGSFFGEMGMAAGLPRTADAFAAGNTTLRRLKQQALFTLMESGSPSGAKVMLALFKTVGPRVRQTNMELVTLYSAGRLLSTEHDPELLADGILQLLIRATGAKTGAVLLYNVTTETLDGLAAVGYGDEDFRLWSEPLGEGWASHALDAGETLVVEDWNADERTAHLPVTGYERVSLLAVPLLTHEEALGVFLLGDRTDETGAYTPFRPADQILVQGVAAMTAAGIANARHEAELREQEKLQRHYIGD